MQNRDLTDGRNFADLLGSFWSSLFDSGALGQAIGFASAEVLSQRYLEMSELISSTSIFSAPIFSRKNVFPVVLRKSLLEDYREYIKYGGGASYGPQRPGGRYAAVQSPQFGVASKVGYKFFYPIKNPPKCYGAFALNRLFEPSVVLTLEDGFFPVEGGISLSENPFENPLFPRRSVQNQKTEEIDEEIVLWFCDVDVENFNIFKKFGYTFTNFRQSSEGFKQIAQAVFSLAAQGPSRFAIRSFLSSICGSPIIREGEEVVQSIQKTPEGVLIITDLSVYKVDEGESLSPEIKEGNTVKAGQPILDLVEISDTSIPGWWKTFEVLPAPKWCIGGEDGAYLGFPSKREKVRYSDADPGTGVRGVSFTVIGLKESVEKFWTEISRRGNEAGLNPGEKLYEKYGDSSSDAPPFWTSPTFFVSPAEILADDIFPGALFPIKIRVNSIADINRFFKTIFPLRDCIPAHLILMLFFVLDSGNDMVPLQNSPECQAEMSLKRILDSSPVPMWSPEFVSESGRNILEPVSIGEAFSITPYHFDPENVDGQGRLLEKIDLSVSQNLGQTIEFRFRPKCLT